MRQRKRTQTRRQYRPGYKTACFPGINVQWPFSQLIFSGDKTVEVRKYALGHRQIAHPDVEMWLVETRCRSVAASNRLLIEGVGPLVHPPPYAQIVGTVTFSEVEQGSWETTTTPDLENPALTTSSSNVPPKGPMQHLHQGHKLPTRHHWIEASVLVTSL